MACHRYLGDLPCDYDYYAWKVAEYIDISGVSTNRFPQLFTRTGAHKRLI